MRAAALAAALAVAAGCGDDPAPPTNAPALADAAPVTRAADAARAETARGFVGVLVTESVDIAPRFDGRVAAVHVRAGDRVEAGAAIADMDPAPLREDLRTAEAALRASGSAVRQADVDVADAERRLERERAEVAAGIKPRQALEDAEMELKRAKAARDRARSGVAEERSRVQTARSRLQEASLRAPFAGTVALRFRDAGATVGPGTPIVRLVGQGGLRLRFAVPPDRARELAIGATVDVDVDTVAAPAPAVIRHISPALDPASGMVLAEAELADGATALDLRPGLAAWVRPRPK